MTGQVALEPQAHNQIWTSAALHLIMHSTLFSTMILQGSILSHVHFLRHGYAPSRGCIIKQFDKAICAQREALCHARDSEASFGSLHTVYRIQLVSGPYYLCRTCDYMMLLHVCTCGIQIRQRTSHAKPIWTSPPLIASIPTQWLNLAVPESACKHDAKLVEGDWRSPFSMRALS